MDNITVEKEKKRLHALLEKVNTPPEKVESIESVIDELAFMRLKLIETRAEIAESNVAIPYDNGGGQSGVRENPLFKGYEALLKSYLSALDRVLSLLPKDIQTEVKRNEEKENVLELVRSMHKKSV